MTRPQIIKLLLPIVLLLGVSHADEPKPSELERRGIVAMKTGAYQQAEDLFAELTEAHPESFVGHYNLAASHSMQGELEQAAESMSKAVALGFSDRMQLLRDRDLEQLRTTEFFDELMEQWGAIIELRRQSDIETLKGLIRKGLETRTDTDYRLEMLSAHDETATDQAHEELRMIADWAQDELFRELKAFDLKDSPWVIVVLPDGAGFTRWAIDTFGPGVRGSISGVGGAYEHQQRRLVAQDLGATLRHEFIHVLHWRDMNRLGQAHAPWVQEGLASLIEDYDMRGDRVVPVASWRTNIVKRLLDARRLPSIEELTRVSMNAFTANRPLSQYAQARALMLWLYETDRLNAFYEHYCAHISEDPSGYTSILAATGVEPDALEHQYHEWVRGLRRVPETGGDLTATLGIEIENGTGDGVVVKWLPSGARARTGLRLGSVITHVNGRPTRDLFELIRVLGDYQSGETITLHHRRGKVHATNKVRLLGR
ncbi:MAG: TPR end-of-group domain-containing protein [Phycisphaerales bacterium JB052]